MAPAIEQALSKIDGRQYPRYRELLGRWDLDGFIFFVDHVQGDPYAAPSRVRVRIPSGVGAHISGDKEKRIAAEDWFLRKFVSNLHGVRRGSGRSGEVSALRPGPEVVERSAVRIFEDGFMEVRFRVGLPAKGRRIMGPAAWRLVDGDVRKACASLVVDETFQPHIESVVRQRCLRRALVGEGLIAFVADGALLPRRSGVDQGPLHDGVRFTSPPSMRVELDGGDRKVSGMGIRAGVTLIVGGGFHGKSTVLQAIERGYLDHVPGDGRELVVAHPDTVKVRAEDGRSVCDVDISMFLRDLPGGKSTRPFSTDDASGSTSQAASIIESVESGAKVLLLDEDTSATNLLVRDERMRRLIPSEQEPITPLVERVRQLHSERGVSTILVIGGVGDYLSVAQSVVGMVAYQARDLSKEASELAGEAPRAPDKWRDPLPRRPLRRGLESEKVRARNGRSLMVDSTEIDLVGVSGVLDGHHAATLGYALNAVAIQANGERTVGTLLDGLDAAIAVEGVDILSPRQTPVGDLILPRRHEVAAALNRSRTLQVNRTDKN